MIVIKENLENKKTLKKHRLGIDFYLWRLWIKLKKRIESSRIYNFFISKPPVFTVIIFVLFLIFLVIGFLFTECEEEMYMSLSTNIETERGIDLACRHVYEDYEEGYIKMLVALEKKEENNNRIYIDIPNIYGKILSKGIFKELLVDRIELSKDILEHSYIELSNPQGKRIYIKENEEKNRYYFDLSELSDKDLNADIYIHIGKNFFPKKIKFPFFMKKTIIYRRYLNFYRNSALEEGSSLEFLFSSKWNVISCPKHESFTDLYVEKHRITSKAKDTRSIVYFIELGTSGDDVALLYTKFGILISVFLSGVTLIISVYFKKKRTK